jgi:hypothetical protein
MCSNVDQQLSFFFHLGFCLTGWPRSRSQQLLKPDIRNHGYHGVKSLMKARIWLTTSQGMNFGICSK